MNLKQRLLITAALYFWAIVGLFFTGSFLLFMLPLGGLVYVLIGGKKHV